MKSQKAITLIALIITIIILLILAGVSIETLTESGLFEKARQAEEKSENAKIEEEITLGDYENKIGEYVNGSRDNETIKSTVRSGSINVPAGTTVAIETELPAINAAAVWFGESQDARVVKYFNGESLCGNGYPYSISVSGSTLYITSGAIANYTMSWFAAY